MSNPLVNAQNAVDPSEPPDGITGIGIVESWHDVTSLNDESTWLESSLGYGGLAMEAVSVVVDPVGTLLSYGVAWLIEHIQPLQEALDWFAGDPDGVQAYSEQWQQVATSVGAAATQYRDSVRADTAHWTGAAGDAYRRHAAERATALTGAGELAGTISSVVGTMGMVVSFVRDFVRDLVADCISRLITYALEALAPPVVSLAWVVPQAVAFIARTVTKIADIVGKLIKTIGNVGPKMARMVEVFGDLMKMLGKGAKFSAEKVAAAGKIASKVADKLDVSGKIADKAADKAWRKLDDVFDTDVAGRHHARAGGGDSGGSDSDGGGTDSPADARRSSADGSEVRTAAGRSSGDGPEAPTGRSTGDGPETPTGAGTSMRSAGDAAPGRADAESASGGGSTSGGQASGGSSFRSDAGGAPVGHAPESGTSAEVRSAPVDAGGRAGGGPDTASSGGTAPGEQAGSAAGRFTAQSGEAPAGGPATSTSDGGGAGGYLPGSSAGHADVPSRPAATTSAAVDAPVRPPNADAPAAAPTPPRQPDQPGAAPSSGSSAGGGPAGGAPQAGAPGAPGARGARPAGWTGTPGSPGAAHLPSGPRAPHAPDGPRTAPERAAHAHRDAPDQGNSPQQPGNPRAAVSRADAPQTPSAPPRADAPTPPRADGPVSPRTDAPMPSRADAPVPPRADGSTPPRADGPVPPRADAPVPPRTDTPVPPRADGSTPPRADAPVSPRADAPVSPRADGPVPSRADAPTPPRAAAPVPPRTDPPVPPRGDAPAAPSPRPDGPGTPHAPGPDSPGARHQTSAPRPAAPQPRFPDERPWSRLDGSDFAHVAPNSAVPWGTGHRSHPDAQPQRAPERSTAESMAAERPVPRHEQVQHAWNRPGDGPAELDLSPELRAKLGDDAHDIGATESGISMVRSGSGVEPPPGAAVDPKRFTIEVHGGPDGVRLGDRDLDAKELAEVIKAAPGYRPGEPVRLISCRTGADTGDGTPNFAQQLAKELDAEVVAPSTDAWVDNFGNVYASKDRASFEPDASGAPQPRFDEPGQWTAFRPDGTTAVHDSPYPPGHEPEWVRNGRLADDAEQRGLLRKLAEFFGFRPRDPSPPPGHQQMWPDPRTPWQHQGHLLPQEHPQGYPAAQGHPQHPGYPQQPGHPEQPGHPQSTGYAQQPGSPQAPGPAQPPGRVQQGPPQFQQQPGGHDLARGQQAQPPAAGPYPHPAAHPNSVPRPQGGGHLPQERQSHLHPGAQPEAQRPRPVQASPSNPGDPRVGSPRNPAPQQPFQGRSGLGPAGRSSEQNLGRHDAPGQQPPQQSQSNADLAAQRRSLDGATDPALPRMRARDGQGADPRYPQRDAGGLGETTARSRDSAHADTTRSGPGGPRSTTRGQQGEPNPRTWESDLGGRGAPHLAQSPARHEQANSASEPSVARTDRADPDSPREGGVPGTPIREPDFSEPLGHLSDGAELDQASVERSLTRQYSGERDVVWRADRDTLYRHDDRPPEQIFADGGGFRARGERVDLWQHLENSRGGLVATTRSESHAFDRAVGSGKGGVSYVYVIEAPGGVDVDEMNLGDSRESEVAFVKNIDVRFIRKCMEVDKRTGEVINHHHNPHFWKESG
ncbi:hypothetical protein [Saccharopolyspora sp. 6V]|uniref:scabin-related ADP-ribosyltransferase n=1 Tax=Saccharopolyspora sp. 6V TaxID=2877239 RepID=UPI001CD6CEA9|nr:hypothetical protein [Saccharopolyspora sp. 6V]MCA1191117.1 hypothetical protein [Saccharopolyspora sp. 6V]